MRFGSMQYIGDAPPPQINTLPLFDHDLALVLYLTFLKIFFNRTTMKQSIQPNNRLGRQERHEAFWQSRKRKFFLVMAVVFLMLQILFIGVMAYLYGSIWKSSARYHRFNILYVDFDGGVIGQALNQAYQQLKAPNFPTLISESSSDYVSPDAVLKAIQNGKWWAAVYSNPGASQRLANALQGGDAAKAYDPTQALTYVWNEVRYPPFSDEAFGANFESLAPTARIAYNMANGTAALKAINLNDEAAVQALLNPIGISDINIMPTEQGTKLFYNTVSMVMPILQQFFFLLILNGISHELQLYSKLPVHISGLVRLGLSVAYDLVAALCMTGYIWGYGEDWNVNGNQFVLTWMLLWLLHHIHFVVLDTVTAFLPLPAIPFVLLTWIILNITASISPFEINPGFYRWGYALPANEAYTTLTDIWSSGSVPKLWRSLPILFSWWIAGMSAATYGHFYRCHKAWTQDQKIEELEKSPSQQHSESSSKEGEIKNHDNDPNSLHRTPSQKLLEAAAVYRDAYGPSVPMPFGLERLFGLVDDQDAPGKSQSYSNQQSSEAQQNHTKD